MDSKTNYLTNSRGIALLGVKEGKPILHSEYDNSIYYILYVMIGMTYASGAVQTLTYDRFGNVIGEAWDGIMAYR